jgi:TorA maturation chaperone TorD
MSIASSALAGQAVTDTDLLRSQQYGFLSRLLGAAPDSELLRQIAGMAGDSTPVGRAYAALAMAAAGADAGRIGREFFELFVGVGRGELLPYASFYLTGFLNERPLADLRGDLARLGVARADGRHEPEDHIAFVLEVMAGLASGRFAGGGLHDKAFFARHVAPWAGQFFDDLAIAPSADFYRPVAEIGRLLIDIETRAFALGGQGASQGEARG